jgi:hypothetical protein
MLDIEIAIDAPREIDSNSNEEQVGDDLRIGLPDVVLVKADKGEPARGKRKNGAQQDQHVVCYGAVETSGRPTDDNEPGER